MVLLRCAVLHCRCLPPHVHVPAQVPIKKLLLWLEMAKQDVAEGQKVPISRWAQVLRDLSS